MTTRRAADPMQDQTKMGVLAGSLLSAIGGSAALRLGPAHGAKTRL